jgi:hypothetical protein
MWYLQDVCGTLENLISEGEDPETGQSHPSGRVYEKILENEYMPKVLQWQTLSNLCCVRLDGSP